MRWTSRAKLLFLAPAVVWVLVFTVFPLVYSLYISVYNVETKMQVKQEKVPVVDADGKQVVSANGQPETRIQVTRQNVTTYKYNGFGNYTRLFHDSNVTTAIGVTFIFVIIAVPGEIILGLVLAVLFNRGLPLRGLWRTIMILPIFATPLAVAYLFFTIFYEAGGPLGFLGIPFLSNPHWAIFSVTLVDIWQWTPFCFLVLLAALQGVPDDLVENALLDTQSRWQIFWHVSLPHLQPTIVIVLLLRFAESLKLFDIPFALTGGGPGIATQSYSLLAYRTGLRYFDIGYASAMAYGLLIFVMIIITMFFRRVRNTYA
jgi:multiple sugar transport system permease protein